MAENRIIPDSDRKSIMRTLLLSFVAFVLVLFSGIAASPPTGTITFWWTDTNAPGSVDAYRIYVTPDPGLPKSNWTVFATIPGGTNQLPTNTFSTNITIGAWTFAMTCSNFWGETGFSSTASTPALLSAAAQLGIRRP